jgi:biotin operon repressor
MKSVNGHRWSSAELKTLMAMWVDNKSLDVMSKELGVSRFAINKMVTRLRKEGIPLPKRTRGHEAGRRNHPWTQSEVEYLIRRREDKATCEQIAQELDRSFLGVQGMIQNLRKQDVQVPMLGCGVRKLWNADSLKAAIAGNVIRLEHKRAA